MTIKEPAKSPYGASAPSEDDPEIAVEPVADINNIPMATAVPVYDDDKPPAYAPGASVIPSSNATNSPNQPQSSTTTTTYTIPAPGTTSITTPAHPATTSTTVTTYTVPAPAASAAGGGENYNGTASMPGLPMSSARVTCPYCRQQMATHVRGQVDCCTVVGVVALLLFFWPLFWLPFVLPCCKTTEHYCSKCHRKVGVVSPCDC